MLWACRRPVAGLGLLLVFATGAFAEEPPLFDMPVACELGRACFIQNYVDADPSASARDYTCGTLSYDGHNGIDFRLPTTAAQQAGVDVLAAAPGRVLRRRDGMADISVREGSRDAVKGAECGNAVGCYGCECVYYCGYCSCRKRQFINHRFFTIPCSSNTQCDGLHLRLLGQPIIQIK